MARAKEINAQALVPDEYLLARDSLKEAERAWANELFVYDEEINHRAVLARAQTEIAYFAAQEKKNLAEIEELKNKRNLILMEREELQVFVKDKDEHLLLREKALREKEQKLDELGEKLSDAQKRLAKLEKDRLELKNQLAKAIAEMGRVQVSNRGLIVSLSNILFGFNEADLKPGAQKNLHKVALLLRDYPDRYILIEGHTDSIGADEFNASLSDRRASAVMDFLRDQGIPEERLRKKGYGERYPIATNATDEGRQQNRRVDLVILDPDKTPQGNYLDNGVKKGG
jgi:outer membrane protein OmpA-like peptidoglycan-associated protein